ncbi:lipid-A-disaccharide synthase [bacterium]|nr:lipid-A-disaccharide synthase [bacterium]
MSARRLKIAFVAAEPSGDWQAGALAQAIADSGADAEMCGVGGSCMEKAGVKVWLNSQDVSCIGPGDALGRIPYFYASYFKLKSYLKQMRPDITVMLDSPALNMRLARFLRLQDLRSLYYIPPSAWTTSAKRLRSIHQRTDGVVCIFRPNAERYAELGLKVGYFGHPIVDMYSLDSQSPEEARRELGTDKPVLAVLPGSRRQEVDNLLPRFVDIAELFLAEHPEAEALIPCATEALHEKIGRYLGEDHPKIKAVLGHTRQALRIARVALTASGSATLEAAMCGVPMAICYRFGMVNWVLGRALILAGLLRVEHFGLPNLVAESRICPELLQHEVCPEMLMPILRELWDDTPRRAQMVADLAKVREALGQPGVLRRVAHAVVSMAEGMTLAEAVERA